MQTNFHTLTSYKIVFISLFLFLPQILLSTEDSEIAKKNSSAMHEKITKPFETKISLKQTELELCVAAVKTEPLYIELETALNNLFKEPTYELYKVTDETYEFIKELESYNKLVIRPELLTKINALLDQLKTYEIFSSLRSTLKKQRVALLELFEEKDLILSVEKILKYQNKELVELITEQKKGITALPTYQQVQELQKKYLETKTVKNLLLCIEKKRDLLIQQEKALLKNKEYQKVLNAHELLSFSLATSEQQQESYSMAKRELLKLQHDLFLVPLENIL